MTDAELKVVSANVDADGSGDISFSEFYAWFAGGTGIDKAVSGGADERAEGVGSVVSSQSRRDLDLLLAASATQNRTVMDVGLKNAAGLGFAKVLLFFLGGTACRVVLRCKDYPGLGSRLIFYSNSSAGNTFTFDVDGRTRVRASLRTFPS